MVRPRTVFPHFVSIFREKWMTRFLAHALYTLLSNNQSYRRPEIFVIRNDVFGKRDRLLRVLRENCENHFTIFQNQFKFYLIEQIFLFRKLTLDLFWSQNSFEKFSNKEFSNRYSSPFLIKKLIWMNSILTLTWKFLEILNWTKEIEISVQFLFNQLCSN